jgi:hypothetical protein
MYEKDILESSEWWVKVGGNQSSPSFGESWGKKFKVDGL